MEIDIEAVRSAAVAARQALQSLPSAEDHEQSVNEGAALLRHESATSNLNTGAERLQELLTELTRLAGDVVDALDQVAASAEQLEATGATRFSGGRR